MASSNPPNLQDLSTQRSSPKAAPYKNQFLVAMMARGSQVFSVNRFASQRMRNYQLSCMLQYRRKDYTVRELVLVLVVALGDLQIQKHMSLPSWVQYTRIFKKC